MGTLSFDLDGTLVTFDFTDAVWHQALPSLYARQKGISADEARSALKSAYDTMGDGRVAWYDLGHWLNALGIDAEISSLMMPHVSLIRTYPEVLEVLEALRREFSLVLISNATRPFLDLEVEQSGLMPFFDRIYSATSDFGKVKEEGVYATILGELGLRGEELIHVGDHHHFDYVVPREVGATAYYLDRTGREQGDSTISDLRDLLPLLGL